ncbi:hypothetical protein EPUL_004335 [Erysiphe pulchra]|uniref:Uncharacterized protein n=1 Tax=Erysiphe pulchra TaxID=225359 RepID=A0A2S4PNQ2_9PEZI|nr:hypothetical protein EPUL_004335 [Erysiphe pulchra]
MRLFALFWILNIQLAHIFATPPNPPQPSAQANLDLDGYECGNVFFTYREINNALSLALPSIDKGYNYPRRYQGKLYSDSLFKEYLIYPISKRFRVLPKTKNPITNFRVVFTRNSNKAVDVIAKITVEDDYTKCIQKVNSHTVPSSSEPEISNGYICGYEFFTDETINESLAIARTKFKASNLFPSPYFGDIYPKDSGYMMWPIISGNKLYTSGIVFGPYYLILSKDRKLVDVVVRGYSNNFLRCIRSRKPPKAPVSDPYSKLFVQPPKTGFFCGKTFFDNQVLQGLAEIIKEKAGKVVKGQFLQECSGPPYDELFFTWPLLREGSLYKRGNKGSYRLVLTPEYKVMSVAVLVIDKLEACVRKTITAKKNHDESGYQCYYQSFSHEQLVKAAEDACVKMNGPVSNRYPAGYEGPGFGSNADGPYFTHPVFQNGVHGPKQASADRVVINTNCEVVGALTTLTFYKISNGDPNNQFLKSLVKCHRLDDGPIPTGFFGPDSEIKTSPKSDHNSDYANAFLPQEQAEIIAIRRSRERAWHARLMICITVISNVDSTLGSFKENIGKEEVVAFKAYLRLALANYAAADSSPAPPKILHTHDPLKSALKKVAIAIPQNTIPQLAEKSWATVTSNVQKKARVTQSSKPQVTPMSKTSISVTNKNMSPSITTADTRLFVRLPQGHKWRKLSPAGIRKVFVKKLAISHALFGKIKLEFSFPGAKLEPATNWASVIVPIVPSKIRKVRGEIDVSSAMLTDEIERVCSLRPAHVKNTGETKLRPRIELG